MQPKIITTKSGRRLMVRPPQAADLDQALIFINNLIAEDTYIGLNNKKPLVKSSLLFLSSA